MAGFDSLGGNSFGNISGQQSPSGYGIQPPTATYNAPSSTLSGGFARSVPNTPANFYSTQATGAIGPDTSAQHNENVAMAMSGFGNIGMNGYRGYPGEVQGSSYSNYGFSPDAYADINAYMTNPLGTWQQPYGSMSGEYGGQGASTNSDRYQMMIDTMTAALTNNWPQEAIDMAKNYGAYTPVNASAAAPRGYSQEQIRQMSSDLPLQFGSAYGTLPPPSAQMVNISPGSLNGVRSF